MAALRLADGKRDLWDVYNARGICVSHMRPLDVSEAILCDTQLAEDRAAAMDEYERQEAKL